MYISKSEVFCIPKLTGMLFFIQVTFAPALIHPGYFMVYFELFLFTNLDVRFCLSSLVKERLYFYVFQLKTNCTCHQFWHRPNLSWKPKIKKTCVQGHLSASHTGNIHMTHYQPNLKLSTTARFILRMINVGCVELVHFKKIRHFFIFTTYNSSY